jgi:hypothetical protein
MLLASDSETAMIQPGRAVPEAICWSFKFHDVPNAKAFLTPADEGCRLLETHLDAGTILVYHHAPFDLLAAAEYRPSLLPKIFKALEDGRIRCTKVRQQLIDIRIGRRTNRVTNRKEAFRKDFVTGVWDWVKPDYTLAGSADWGGTGLVGLYFGKDRSADKGPDAWRTRYAELKHLPISMWPEKAVSYALDDADDTLAVYLAQYALAIEAGGLLPDGHTVESLLINELEQNRASFVLSLISAQGIRTNGETLDELERRCGKVRDEIRTKLMEQNLFRFDGPKTDPKRKIVRNNKIIQQRVIEAFAKQGLPAPRNDPTTRNPEGSIKIDKDPHVLSDDPYLAELADAGPASTVLQTFIPALRQGVHHPINTRFDTMLDNGRISSSGPNLNNLPRGETLQALIGMDIREAVVPRPGNVFCSVDFDCAELRSHAQVNVWLAEEHGWDYPEMAKFFQADPNGDPHLELAAHSLGISREEALARKKAGDKEIKHRRQSSKPTNFGLPGGMGPPKLVESARKSYGVKMTLSEGRKAKDAWKSRWPEMTNYLNYISERTQAPFDVKQFVSNRIRGRTGYSEAANSYWSGLTADGAKHALWLVARECYLEAEGSPLFGSRIGLFVYDEVIIESPIPKASAAGQRLAEVMIRAMRVYLPDIPVTASPALMDRWRKGAEPCWVDGELVPWIPKPKEAA